jgi:thiamine-monophosphate kinase
MVRRKPKREMKKREGAPAGELALLERIRSRVGRSRGSDVVLGIGDDCALLRVRPGEEWAVTTDLSLEGRHFRLGWHAPESIGHRTLARGLSDLAGMGARPVAAFLSLGLPAALADKAGERNGHSSWVDRFLNGFLALARTHKVPLAGGDLAESPAAVADIVLIGAVRRGKALLRSGARPGDALYVTGFLGGSAAGLRRLEELARAQNLKRDDGRECLKIPGKLKAALAAHFYPQPRVAQGLALVRRGLAHAAMDVSDGLSTDLHHLCEASGVAAEIDASALPVAAGATLAQALNGGEDYELLFSAAPQARMPRALSGVPVTRIGRVLRRDRRRPMVTLLGASGERPLAPRGWQHFS